MNPQKEHNEKIFKLNHHARYHVAAGIILNKLEKYVRGRIYVNYDEAQDILMIHIETRHFKDRFKLKNAYQTFNNLDNVPEIAAAIIEEYKRTIYRRYFKQIVTEK